MNLYFLMLGGYTFISLLLKIIQDGGLMKVRKFYIIAFAMIFGIVSALRNVTVGVDTRLYTILFGQMGYSYDFVHSKYPLYEMLNVGLHHISDNPQILTACNSILITICISLGINQFSKNTFLSGFLYVSLYFYFYSMNISRQYLALGILLVAVIRLFKNKPIHFFILYIAAVLVHSTAIVGGIFYVIYKIKWNIKKYAILTFVVISSFLLYDKLIELFIRFFPIYGGYFSENSNGVTLLSQSEGNKILLTFFYLIYLILGIFISYKYQDKLDIKFEFLTAVMIISVVSGLIFSKNILIGRIELFFTLYIIFYIPEVNYYLSKLFSKSLNDQKIYLYLLNFFVLAISVVPMVFQLMKNISGVVPYEIFLK